jgi:hypothetical protein
LGWVVNEEDLSWLRLSLVELRSLSHGSIHVNGYSRSEIMPQSPPTRVEIRNKEKHQFNFIQFISNRMVCEHNNLFFLK